MLTPQPQLMVSFDRSSSFPPFVRSQSYRLNEDFPVRKDAVFLPIHEHSTRKNIAFSSKRPHSISQVYISPRNSPSLTLHRDSFRSPPPVEHSTLSPPPLRPLRRRRLNTDYFSPAHVHHLSLPILLSEKIGTEAAGRRLLPHYTSKLRPRFLPPPSLVGSYQHHTPSTRSVAQDQGETRNETPSRFGQKALTPTSTRKSTFDRDHMSFVTSIIDESCCSALPSDLRLSELYSAFENVGSAQEKNN
jgi:hypothetical protein